MEESLLRGVFSQKQKKDKNKKKQKKNLMKVLKRND